MNTFFFSFLFDIIIGLYTNFDYIFCVNNLALFNIFICPLMWIKLNSYYQHHFVLSLYVKWCSICDLLPCPPWFFPCAIFRAVLPVYHHWMAFSVVGACLLFGKCVFPNRGAARREMFTPPASASLSHWRLRQLTPPIFNAVTLRMRGLFRACVIREQVRRHVIYGRRPGELARLMDWGLY